MDYNTFVLAKSMKGALAPQNIEDPQVVVHYHYHYFIDGKDCPSPNPPKQEGLRRVRSYEKEYLLQKYQKNLQIQSNSSKQSWKRLIKPHLQSTSPTLPAFSHSSPFLRDPQRLDKSSPNSTLRPTVSEFGFNTPKNPEKKERSISYKFPQDTEHSFRAETPSQLSPFREEGSLWGSEGCEQLSQKSRFSKKRQIEILNANRLKELTEHKFPLKQKSNEEQSYRWRLLEEECAYLRSHFMGHLQRFHGEAK